MKKTLSAAGVVLALALAVPAFAQPGGGMCGGMHGGMHWQAMSRQLNLSDKQQEQFKQLHRAARDKMQATRDKMQDNRDAMRKLDPSAKGYMAQVDKLAAEKGKLVETMVKQHARLRAEVSAMLTPEQRNKLSELRKQRQDKCGKWHRRGGMGRGPGGGMGYGGGPGGGMGSGPRGTGM